MQTNANRSRRGSRATATAARGPSTAKKGTVASRLSWTPHPCVVLAIDPGETSGWAVVARGRLEAFGLARTIAERAEAVARAQAFERELGTLVVAGEKWAPFGWKTFDTVLGLSANWGRWAEQIELAGHPDTRVLRVLVATWRSATVGHHKGTPAYKAAAVQRARASFRLSAHIDVPSDAAEAICIAEWGSRAPEVLEVLPKAVREGRA